MKVGEGWWFFEATRSWKDSYKSKPLVLSDDYHLAHERYAENMQDMKTCLFGSLKKANRGYK